MTIRLAGGGGGREFYRLKGLSIIVRKDIKDIKDI